MFQLILVLIAIGLMSSMLVVGINYINPVPGQANALSERLEHGLNAMRTGFSQYVVEHTVPPPSLAALTPHYAFLPAPLPGTAWSFGSAGTMGRYLCLSGTFDLVSVGAILRLRKVYSPQAYFIGPQCGLTANGALPVTGHSFTGAVTLWLSSYI